MKPAKIFGKRMQGKSSQKSRTGLAASGLILAAAVTVGLTGTGLVTAENADAGIVHALEAADIGAWQPWKFKGETRYTPEMIDGRRVIKAVSDSSASGYYRRLKIDLYMAPVMHWSWRVDNTFGNIDETAREGDDSPARVYVLVAHSVLFWKTRAIAYVWSSAQPAGTDWPNAYTNQERVIAVRSGEQGVGEWHQEQRNVREDFRRYFDEDVRYVDAVAFMTDTDNTGRRAVAYYGDIFFADK